ncbi:MAG TPA: DUF1284 domain-containing protein [Planctomycetota bacterium]|nr:DUF1284 domain-containing protein [Planctomycetota bacterium]
MRIRAHNLLCIQGFVGKGYSEEFVANMKAIVGGLGGGTQVTVLDEPDNLCAKCPNLKATGCALHGEGTERGIVAQDRDVLDRLGLEAGQTIAWGEILDRIRASVEPDDLDDICGSCPWLPLGHCKAGLKRLRAARS